MQFIVPQFIDIETKIIGPITPRQFIILIVTGGLIFISYKLFDFALFILAAVVLFGIGGALAFFRVNGRPVHYFLLNVFQTMKKPGTRVWRKEFIPVVEKRFKDKTKEKKEEKIIIPRKPLSTARLSQAALLVDTGGRYEEE